jgi:hypothetical protein
VQQGSGKISKVGRDSCPQDGGILVAKHIMKIAGRRPPYAVTVVESEGYRPLTHEAGDASHVGPAHLPGDGPFGKPTFGSLGDDSVHAQTEFGGEGNG